MSKRPRDVKRVAGYFPAELFERLEKRAEKNYHSMSCEIVHIVGKFFQQEEQEQTKQTVTA